MEVGRAYFETDKKHFTILDAPGHKERNISCNYHLNLKFTCSYSVKYVRDFISVSDPYSIESGSSQNSQS